MRHQQIVDGYHSWEEERCVGQNGAIPRLGFRSMCLQDSPLGVRFGMLLRLPVWPTGWLTVEKRTSFPPFRPVSTLLLRSTKVSRMLAARPWAQSTEEKVSTYNWDQLQVLLVVHRKEAATGKVSGELGRVH